MTDNPIIKKLISIACSGRKLARVSCDKQKQADRSVYFFYEDGSQEDLPTSSDQQSFMAWWKDAGRFIRHVKVWPEIPDDPSTQS